MTWRGVTGVVTACAGFILAGCGFHPLYGRNGSGPAAIDIFKAIYVEPIPDRTGYELRNKLIDLLDSSGRASGAAFRLKITIAIDKRAVALQNDATITRYNYFVTANYVLSDVKGVLVTQGRESTLAAYNVVASPYATLIAEQDAQRRAADDLSERIRLDLGVFFARHKGAMAK